MSETKEFRCRGTRCTERAATKKAILIHQSKCRRFKSTFQVKLRSEQVYCENWA